MPYPLYLRRSPHSWPSRSAEAGAHLPWAGDWQQFSFATKLRDMSLPLLQRPLGLP